MNDRPGDHPSVLARLVDGSISPGVYRWDGIVDDALWQEALRRDDVWLVAVDGKRAATKEDTLDAFADALRFPDWFGRNFDAFADLLGALEGTTVVLWEGWGGFADSDPESFETVLDILRERAERPGFSALLRGDGPAGPATTLPRLEG